VNGPARAEWWDVRVDDEKTYSTVRYSTNQVAYTTTSTGRDECRRCGQPLIEADRKNVV
jgi:hypothetical protein